MSPANFIDLTGQRFDRLLVLERAPTARKWRPRWLCLCDCGQQVLVVGGELHSGHTRSCGCLHREQLIARNTKHGKARRKKQAPEYISWGAMKYRCLNPKDPVYRNYGGRGIKVCQWWLNSFENFLEDMGRKPGPEYSIDRYPDNDGNYEPENCRWATASQQNLNSRQAVSFIALSPHKEIIEAKGINKFARKYDLRQSCVSLCLSGKQKTHKGWRFYREETYVS